MLFEETTSFPFSQHSATPAPNTTSASATPTTPTHPALPDTPPTTLTQIPTRATPQHRTALPPPDLPLNMVAPLPFPLPPNCLLISTSPPRYHHGPGAHIMFHAIEALMYVLIGGWIVALVTLKTRQITRGGSVDAKYRAYRERRLREGEELRGEFERRFRGEMEGEARARVEGRAEEMRGRRG
ncbi:hypothetical protein P153DRAFT_385149 [Dothidotthia symphoricarpi CBS 119687]|uniref:Uncharacterized protein n=1 Tax=Dothidotthia symphoricarpi CBS 119687 TaxID=1392245 RepID=A0A6A6AEB9_9PLEO|nr:uncharacterized protein P153DRAFT_385149 [Dothidotthia symphoricarpi CBS 119687]KAF2129916.1 hypothetical protein P153DRAFT_385149 [Dothidotthia symphoricarpi CBS 119687]